MKLREYLLIKSRAQNRYNNRVKDSGLNFGTGAVWYSPCNDMENKIPCAICGSLDHNVLACSSYKLNMKAIGRTNNEIRSTIFFLQARRVFLIRFNSVFQRSI